MRPSVSLRQLLGISPNISDSSPYLNEKLNALVRKTKSARKRNLLNPNTFLIDISLFHTEIQKLSHVELAGFLRLILAQWTAPACALPLDDTKLAKLSGLGSLWPEHRKAILSRFDILRPSYIRHRPTFLHWLEAGLGALPDEPPQNYRWVAEVIASWPLKQSPRIVAPVVRGAILDLVRNQKLSYGEAARVLIQQGREMTKLHVRKGSVPYLSTWCKLRKYLDIAPPEAVKA
jgi:hypothetical protein